ncbi:MAG: YfhO family protein, partial [Oscillospiraceae bacterium]
LGEWALTTLTGQYTALFHRYAPTDSQKLLLSDDIDGSIATPLDRTAARILYVIPIERPTVLYLDCFDGASTRLTEHVNGAMSVRVNGIECVASYPSQRENGLLELGYFSEGSVVVELMVKHGVSARSFGVFGLDVNALRGALGAVRGAALNATGRTLSGSAVAEQDGEQLVIQLPWSQGWHATVNGQEHEIEQILGAFMAISLEKGQNCVEMTFFPVGMGMALGIGVVGALAFCWAAHSRRRRKASSDLVVKAALGTLSVCCWLIFFLVYLLPPALWLLM